MGDLANITGAAKVAALVGMVILSHPRIEQKATEQLKKYIDLVYLRTILFIFALCA